MKALAFFVAALAALSVVATIGFLIAAIWTSGPYYPIRLGGTAAVLFGVDLVLVPSAALLLDDHA